MARLKRREYPDAIYHVINRGNYRSDVFGSEGAADAFVKVLSEATMRFGWRLGAYVVMRNHYHLAVQTPEPNLAAGMQWLQVTFAARFNRLRKENGHLFQGRYRAIVLQNEGVWARVADYIHLNPARAQVFAVEHLAQFRWSSLARIANGSPFLGLEPDRWLKILGFRNTRRGWVEYQKHLIRRFEADPESKAKEREELSRGWAIGSVDWKQQLLDSSSKTAGKDDVVEHREPRGVREMNWERLLKISLEAVDRNEEELKTSRKNASWKVKIADELQREHGASVTWLAAALNMGNSATARGYLWRYRNQKN